MVWNVSTLWNKGGCPTINTPRVPIGEEPAWILQIWRCGTRLKLWCFWSADSGLNDRVIYKNKRVLWPIYADQNARMRPFSKWATQHGTACVYAARCQSFCKLTKQHRVAFNKHKLRVLHIPRARLLAVPCRVCTSSSTSAPSNSYVHVYLYGLNPGTCVSGQYTLPKMVCDSTRSLRRFGVLLTGGEHIQEYQCVGASPGLALVSLSRMLYRIMFCPSDWTWKEPWTLIDDNFLVSGSLATMLGEVKWQASRSCWL